MDVEDHPGECGYPDREPREEDGSRDRPERGEASHVCRASTWSSDDDVEPPPVTTHAQEKTNPASQVLQTNSGKVHPPWTANPAASANPARSPGPGETLIVPFLDGPLLQLPPHQPRIQMFPTRPRGEPRRGLSRVSIARFRWKQTLWRELICDRGRLDARTGPTKLLAISR